MTAASITTIVFTDIVGSTEHMQRLGDEEAAAAFEAHYAFLRSQLQRYGGEEIQWLGDGLMASFGSVGGALRFAASIQAHGPRWPDGAPIRLRIGLNAGEVVHDDDGLGYFGTPVVTARRLCDRAAPGAVLCTTAVAALVVGRADFRFRDLGTIALKGLADPVSVCELLLELGASSVAPPATSHALPEVPLPALLGCAEQFPFVGRHCELDALTSAWRACSADGERVVFIEGEPGIGKTRLAGEIARAAHASGGVVLFGRCDEGLAVPFQPFVEILEHFVTHVPDPALPTQLGHHAGELARLYPDLALHVARLPSPTRSDAATEQYRLFEAVASWLGVVAGARPLLLVLDDLHWAAKPTLHLVRHLVRACQTAPLLIVGTHRDTEVDRRHPLADLLADLHTTSNVRRMPVRGLDPDEVVAFMEHAGGQVLDAGGRGLARAVQNETAGNPFFVGEVLRHLAESGAIVQREGRWVSDRAVADLGLTSAVRDVVVRRVARLSVAAAETLTLAAAIGRDFELAVLCSVSSLDEDNVLSALDAAVNARLVDETGPDAYRFAHALVRSALYRTLTASRRVRLHRRIAEAIEARRPDDVTALAYHFTEAGPAMLGKSIDYTIRAADLARARLAHDQAMQLYERSLGLLDHAEEVDSARRCDVLTRLGLAARSAGAPVFRETLLAAGHLAQRLGDAQRLAAAALANNRGWASQTGKVDQERVAMLTAALAALPPDDSPARACLLATLAAELLFDRDRPRRVALSDEALAMARRLGEPATLAHVLNARSHAIWGPENLAERLANTAEHVAIARELHDPLAHWYACATRPQACMEAGELHEVDVHLSTLWQLTLDLGQPHQRWAATIDLAWRALLAGRFADAERLAVEAGEIGTAAGQRDALSYAVGQLIAIRHDQGRLGELAPLLETSPSNVPALRAALALALCADGKMADAARVLDEVARQGFECLPVDMTWTTTVTTLADVAARLTALDRAADLYEILAPWSGLVVFNGLYVFGTVSRALGLLAAVLHRLDAADAHYAHAAEQLTKLDAEPWLARVHMEWADMLGVRDRSGDAERATMLRRSAAETAGRLGLTGIEGIVAPAVGS